MFNPLQLLSLDNSAGDGSSTGFCPTTSTVNGQTVTLKCFNSGNCKGCITGSITGTSDVSNGCTETLKPACNKDSQLCEACKSKQHCKIKLKDIFFTQIRHVCSLIITYHKI